MLKRPESFFATLVMFLPSLLVAGMLSFDCPVAFANPTQKQTLKKIAPDHSENNTTTLDLERELTLTPTFSGDKSSPDKVPGRHHLVHNHYNLGLGAKVGTFYKDQTSSALVGLHFAATKILDIEKAYELSLSAYSNSWWQALIGLKYYFHDEPFSRPFYAFEFGTQMNPSQSIGNFIVYERYSAGAKVGLESVYREVAYCVDADILASISGIHAQFNFSLQKPF